MKSRLTLMACAAVILFGVVGVFQVANLLIAIISLAALAFLLADHRYPLGLAAAMAALAASWFMGNAFLAMETVILVIVPAVIMAMCIRANKPAPQTIIFMVIPALVLATLFFAEVGHPAAYFNRIEPQMERDFIDLITTLGVKDGLHMAEDEFGIFVDRYMNATRLVFRFLPAIFLTSYLLISVLSYRLVGWAIRSENRYLLILPPFLGWKLDERLLLPLGLALALGLYGGGVLSAVGENAALFLFALFVLGGLSLIEFVVRKNNLHRMIRIAIFAGLILFHYYAALVVGTAGALDSHFDFRRLRAARLG